jgi:hypothetical protein
LGGGLPLGLAALLRSALVFLPRGAVLLSFLRASRLPLDFLHERVAAQLLLELCREVPVLVHGEFRGVVQEVLVAELGWYTGEDGP